jgi:hypothetical protein
MSANPGFVELAFTSARRQNIPWPGIVSPRPGRAGGLRGSSIRPRCPEPLAKAQPAAGDGQGR